MREKKPTTGLENTSINWDQAAEALNAAKEARRVKDKAARDYARLAAKTSDTPNSQRNRVLRHSKIGGLAVATAVGVTLALFGGDTNTAVEKNPVAQAPQQQLTVPDQPRPARKEQRQSEKPESKQERPESRKARRSVIKRYASPLPAQRPTYTAGNSDPAENTAPPRVQPPVVEQSAQRPSRSPSQSIDTQISGGANFGGGSSRSSTGGATSDVQPSRTQDTGTGGGAVAHELPAAQASGGAAAR
ncbi:MAG: hypothetical protein ACR2FM_03660 [Candidatus Saccharimonadales bacterium]